MTGVERPTPHSDLKTETDSEYPIMATKKQSSKIARQKANLRRSLWPSLDENDLWTHDKGWLIVPRAFPLLLRIMDRLAGKGKPVSWTYLDLWCRTFEDSFVIASQPGNMAFSSGFSGERARHTWATRIRSLHQLGFIDVKPGPNGPIHYILLHNPFVVLRDHIKEGRIPESLVNALYARMIEVGATDLEDLNAEG